MFQIVVKFHKLQQPSFPFLSMIYFSALLKLMGLLFWGVQVKLNIQRNLFFQCFIVLKNKIVC